jgi:WD40 repeat protein
LLAAAMGNYESGHSNFGRVRIWDTASWQTLYDLCGHSGCVWSVDFSPSGKRLASAAGQPLRSVGGKPQTPPGEFKIWDMATGEEMLTIPSQVGAAYGVAFSPDGAWLATAGGGASVRIWDGTPLANTPAYEPLPDVQ